MYVCVYVCVSGGGMWVIVCVWSDCTCENACEYVRVSMCECMGRECVSECVRA
jgi:hypothetical protein